jgi:hypothetical protein
MYGAHPLQFTVFSVDDPLQSDCVHLHLVDLPGETLNDLPQLSILSCIILLDRGEIHWSLSSVMLWWLLVIRRLRLMRDRTSSPFVVLLEVVRGRGRKLRGRRRLSIVLGHVISHWLLTGWRLVMLLVESLLRLVHNKGIRLLMFWRCLISSEIYHSIWLSTNLAVIKCLRWRLPSDLTSIHEHLSQIFLHILHDLLVDIFLFESCGRWLKLHIRRALRVLWVIDLRLLLRHLIIECLHCCLVLKPLNNI